MFKEKKVLFVCRFIRRFRSKSNWIQLITEDGCMYKYDLPKDPCYFDEYLIDLNPINIDDIKPEVMLDKQEILLAYNLSKNIKQFDFKTFSTAKDAGNEFLFVERKGSFIKIAKNGNSSGGVICDSAKQIYKILSKIGFFSPKFIQE